jgi:hypothetical protein
MPTPPLSDHIADQLRGIPPLRRWVNGAQAQDEWCSSARAQAQGPPSASLLPAAAPISPAVKRSGYDQGQIVPSTGRERALRRFQNHR